MKKALFILLIMCLSLPVFPQGAGGHITPPQKKPQPTQPTKKPRKRQNQPVVSQQKVESKTCSDELITVSGVSFNMICVPGGTFMMGATNEQDPESEDYEKPTHQVTLSSFSIGETEVTQELWEAVMGSNPSHFKGQKLPVESVSWEDCQVFILKLNLLTGLHFRLPTEAEWEYAARGGRKSQGYKYAGSNDIDKVAWYDSNSSNTTHDVAMNYPNELGLYDMNGNVSEWCQSKYGSYNSSSQTNPQGGSSDSFRVFRGGNFIFNASSCRVSSRAYSWVSYRNINLGLRLAL